MCFTHCHNEFNSHPCNQRDVVANQHVHLIGERGTTTAFLVFDSCLSCMDLICVSDNCLPVLPGSIFGGNGNDDVVVVHGRKLRGHSDS